MKTVSGKIVSVKPVNLSKAANILANFVDSDNGASQTVSAYLRRTSVAFKELVNFKKHHKLKKKSKEEASSISVLSQNLEEDENKVLGNGGVNRKIEDKLRKKEKKRKTDGSLGSGETGNIKGEFEEGDEMVKRKSEDKKKKKKKKRKNSEVDGGENGNSEAPESKKRRRIEADE